MKEKVSDYDFYSVQTWVDGFGNNDTYTMAIFKTEEECKKYLDEYPDCVIVGQKWGDYTNYFD